MSSKSGTSSLAALTLGAVGVVYGDIGTSPLYALREVFASQHAGHFGSQPIRIAWFVLVFPVLLLNYFGQGALMLIEPAKADNPKQGAGLVPDPEGRDGGDGDGDRLASDDLGQVLRLFEPAPEPGGRTRYQGADLSPASGAQSLDKNFRQSA